MFVRAHESPPVNKSRGSFVTHVTLALEDLAFLHDERDPLRGRDVLGRVAGHGDDVGALPGRQRADAVGDTEQLGIRA